MLSWNELQATLKPYVEVNSTSVLILVLLGLVSLSFFQFYPSFDLPGPSIWQYLPNGELYPLVRDSRATGRTLLKLRNKYGEVFQTWLGPRHVIMSSNPADVAQILSAIGDFVRPEDMISTFDTFMPGGLLSMPKEIHMAARKKLKDTFNPSMLDYCHKYLTDAVTELCEVLQVTANKSRAGQSPNTVDISPSISTATFRIIVSIAFGCDLSRKKRAAFYGWVDQITDEMMKDLIYYPIRQALTPVGTRSRFFQARSQLYSICKELISRRLEETPQEKSSRSSDALDAIVSLSRNDLTTIISQSLLFSIAGSHTTSQGLAWCIYEICSNHRVEAEVHREVDSRLSSIPLSEPLTPEDVRGMTYLHKVWKETLRLHSLGSFLLRKTSRDVVLRGSHEKLPKGTHVAAFVQGVQTNPGIWRDPQKFIPDRWGSGTERGEGDKVPKGSYAPFALGQRSCLGKFLADYEAVLILAELYRRFKFTLACDPSEIVASSMWVEGPRCAGGKGGDIDMGVPVQIHLQT